MPPDAVIGTKLWESIRASLQKHGIDTDCCSGAGDAGRVKVVCIAPDLQCSVEEMSKSARDQVCMVRVDEATSRMLDAWVETGAVKSRSEAAALFIREGLKVRQTELDQLKEALHSVEEAKQKLRDRAREVFGSA